MEKLYELLELRKNNKIDEYRSELKNLTREEQILLDLHLRKVALGEIKERITGMPSLDKVWLKYYKEEHIKAEIPEMTALEYLKKANENNLDGIAFNSVEGLMKYQEFFEEIDRVAASLHKMGTEKGKIVLGVLPAETIHEALLIYAVDKTGAAISTFPEMATPEDICESINDYNTEYIFIYDRFLTDELEKSIYSNTNLKNIIVVNLDRKVTFKDARTMTWDEFISKGKGYNMPEIKRNPADLFFMAKTGGTSGKPKSVMLSDNSFNMKVHELINSDLDYEQGDKWLRLWPLFSASAAITSSHIALCKGMECVLRNYPMTPEEWENMIIETKPNHLILVPILMDWLEQSKVLKKEHLESIKSAGVGGSVIQESFEKRIKEFFERFGLDIFLGIGYGQTENGPTISMRMNHETSEIGKVGAPLVNTVVGIFNPETQEELGYGEEGEICVRSGSRMIGYYNDPELTKEAIKTHSDGLDWLHTGDLGYLTENGLVCVTGRMTRYIFTYPTAEKAYPDVIEGVISSVPGVVECIVGSLPCEGYEGYFYPIAFIVPDEEINVEELKENIQAVCEQFLPEYSRPHKIYEKEVFPLMPSGKPDVRAMEEEVQNSIILSRNLPEKAY